MNSAILINTTMKAMIYQKYGAPEVLHISDVEKPTPKDNEVLIKINATTVTAGDFRLRKADPFMTRFFTGLLKPKNPILGHELAGEIMEVGNNVKRFKVGDKVYGSTGLESGTYADYISLPEDAPLVKKPNNISDEEAAAIPVGATTALHFLKKANVKPGQKVLINGASGSVGTFAVQLAKLFGAKVTAITSTANMAMVKALGADAVIDYTTTDFTKSNETYDVIFDTVGKITYADSKNSLKQNGHYVTTFMNPSIVFSMMSTSVIGDKKIVGGVALATVGSLTYLNTLIEAGKLKPVIDREYPLAQISLAHSYAEKGHKKGNVVIKVA